MSEVKVFSRTHALYSPGARARAHALLAGVRSPPLRGVDDPREHGLAGEGPGIMWRPVFSEGRGLRARIARPN